MASSALVFSLVFLCSCVSVGTKFPIPTADQLAFGKMTADEALVKFGHPRDFWSKTTTNGTYILYTYIYGQADLSKASWRILLLEFRDGELNGYIGASTFSNDKTKFNPAIVNQLKDGVGKLTRDDVVNLVGQPSGKALCPSILKDFKDSCDKNTEIWGWLMSDNTDLWIRREGSVSELRVAFDANGKISDVELIQNTD